MVFIWLMSCAISELDPEDVLGFVAVPKFLGCPSPAAPRATGGGGPVEIGADATLISCRIGEVAWRFALSLSSGSSGSVSSDLAWDRVGEKRATRVVNPAPMSIIFDLALGKVGFTFLSVIKGS